ncbi:hypothetical protein MKX36_12350 [Paenibacillus sp. FSL W8-0439]|uniref:hypothetical protein n=1 Tax=Paenibacillus sp. FSL W8-0439 TaxID=2921716 RepID=UPI0030FC4C68
MEFYVQYGPVVTWQRVDSKVIPSVFMDHYHAYWEALEYLYQKGYRRILSVTLCQEG